MLEMEIKRDRVQCNAWWMGLTLLLRIANLTCRQNALCAISDEGLFVAMLLFSYSVDTNGEMRAAAQACFMCAKYARDVIERRK